MNVRYKQKIKSKKVRNLAEKPRDSAFTQTNNNEITIFLTDILKLHQKEDIIFGLYVLH